MKKIVKMLKKDEVKIVRIGEFYGVVNRKDGSYRLAK